VYDTEREKHIEGQEGCVVHGEGERERERGAVNGETVYCI